MLVATPLDNSTFLASQAMQGAAAFAFALAAIGLHRKLRRPTTFAWAGAWIGVTLGYGASGMAGAMSLSGSLGDGWSLATGLAVATLGASGIWTVGAAALSTGREFPRARLVSWSIASGASFMLVDLVCTLLIGGTERSNTAVHFFVGRGAVLLGWTAGAVIAWRAENRGRYGVRALQWAFTLLVVRIGTVFVTVPFVFSVGPTGFQPPIPWTIFEMVTIAFLGVSSALVLIGEEHEISLAAADAARAAQDDLRQRAVTTERMEALGRLAGTVAHDFSNVLTVIGGMAEAAKADLAGQAGPHEEIAEIEKATRRGADLTRQLLAFARQQPAEPRVEELDERVADLETMLRRAAGDAVDLRVNCAGERCRVKMDVSQFDQALINLTVNARDAMPAGGRLDLIVERLPASPSLTAEMTAPPGASVACVTVRDTGEGIPPQVMPKLFEPFFTTKPKGKGTGLGLASVYGFARQHGGTVTVESTVGEGTTFRIWLPLQPDAA